MEATQLAHTIDKVIGKNAVIQELKDGSLRQSEEQRRQSEEQRRQSEEQRRQGEEQHRQGVLLENIQDQVQIIAEALTPLLKNSEAMPKIKNIIESHKQEISLTQQALKNHINDANAHNNSKKP